MYRKSSGGNAGSSLTLESAAFGGGLMTPSGVMFYVTDYLGSVRAERSFATPGLCVAKDVNQQFKQNHNETNKTFDSNCLPVVWTVRTGKRKGLRPE